MAEFRDLEVWDPLQFRITIRGLEAWDSPVMGFIWCSVTHPSLSSALMNKPKENLWL